MTAAEGIRNDQRADPSAKPYGYVVFLDTFLSNWGEAKGGKSYYALAVDSEAEAYTVLANGRARTEMKRGRFSRSLPRIGPHDHLSVVDKTVAPRWYQAGEFQRDKDEREKREREEAGEVRGSKGGVKRYIGDAVIDIAYHDAGDYRGTVTAGGHTWSFDRLMAPAAGMGVAYDSPEAYDKMAASAVGFGSYYTTGNRGDDTPDWAPSAAVADAISEATAWAQDDKGQYDVRRTPGGRARKADETKAGEATPATRDYEWTVYPSARVEGKGEIIHGTSLTSGLDRAVAAAKKMGPGAAVYGSTHGGFVGYVTPSGRWQPVHYHGHLSREDEAAEHAGSPDYEKIKRGSSVTIVDRFGVEHTGRAVMLGPHGWVLNMGGRHGTPAVATPANVVRSRNPRRSK